MDSTSPYTAFTEAPIPNRSGIRRSQPQAPLSGALPPRLSTPVPVAIVSSAPPLAHDAVVLVPEPDPLAQRLEVAFNRQFPDQQNGASAGPRTGVGSQGLTPNPVPLHPQGRDERKGVSQPGPTAGHRTGVGSQAPSVDPVPLYPQGRGRPYVPPEPVPSAGPRTGVGSGQVTSNPPPQGARGVISSGTRTQVGGRQSFQ